MENALVAEWLEACTTLTLDDDVNFRGSGAGFFVAINSNIDLSE